MLAVIEAAHFLSPRFDPKNPSKWGAMRAAGTASFRKGWGNSLCAFVNNFTAPKGRRR
jgi:hypothetical protein